MTQLLENDLEATTLGTPRRELALRVHSPHNSGPSQVVLLAGQKVSIGTAPECTMQLAGAGASPCYCLVLRGEAHDVVRSLSPEVRLNGEPFNDAPLRTGDRLQLDEVELEVLSPVDQDREEAAALREQAQSEREQARQEVETAEARAAELARREQDARDTAERLAEEQSALERARHELDEQRQAFAREREEVERQQVAAAAESTEIAQRVAEVDAAREALASERRTIEEERQRLAQESGAQEAARRELTAERESLDAARAEFATRQQELDSERKSNAERQTILEAARAAAEEISTERAALAREREEILTEREALTAARQAASEPAADPVASGDAGIEVEREALRQEREAWEEERRRWDADCERWERESREFQLDLERREQELERAMAALEEERSAAANMRFRATDSDEESESFLEQRRETTDAARTEPVEDARHDDEDSIHDYMKQLLQRAGVQRDVMSAAQPQRADQSVPLAVEPEVKPAPQVERPARRPERPRPQQVADLSQMREIANQTAQGALARHSERRLAQQRLNRILVGGGSVSFVTIVLASLGVFPVLTAALSVAAAAVAFLGWRQYKLSMRRFEAAAGEKQAPEKTWGAEVSAGLTNPTPPSE